MIRAEGKREQRVVFPYQNCEIQYQNCENKVRFLKYLLFYCMASIDCYFKTEIFCHQIGSTHKKCHHCLQKPNSMGSIKGGEGDLADDLSRALH